jgi:hypothetical protein
MKTIIVFYKFSRLANAPDEIFKILEKYNKEYNKKYNKKYILHFVNNKPVILNFLLKKYKDERVIVHFHNKYLKSSLLNKKNVKKIIHYHSEPSGVSLRVPVDYYRLVLNQYHCTLKEYRGCSIVRNSFFNEKKIIFNKKIKIGYYPSTTIRHNKYYDKGYPETLQILYKIHKIFPNVIIDVKHGISYSECINRKRDCHIIIDECKTGSFHKTTLEGLSLGCIVIVNINKLLEEIHKKLYGVKLPVINVNLKGLEYCLNILLKTKKSVLEKMAIEKMNIFNKYWNNKIVSEEYFGIYKSISNTF